MYVKEMGIHLKKMLFTDLVVFLVTLINKKKVSFGQLGCSHLYDSIDLLQPVLVQIS